MPFKTKKTKLAAAHRRYTLIEKIPMKYKSYKRGNFQKTVKIHNEKQQIKEKSIEENYLYLKKDLLSIIAFSLLIFTVQIILFFVI